VIRIPFISCLTVLAIAACSARHPVDSKAARTSGLPDINVAAPSATGEPRGSTAAAKAEPAPTAKIPASLQGRWGLSPADCMSNRAGARGLLVVTPDDLHFYESRSVPASDVGTDDNSIAGNFAFNGEGRSWTKFEALRVDKQTLTRTETNPSASFSYAKCS
jgi:hypothetical protein